MFINRDLNLDFVHTITRLNAIKKNVLANVNKIEFAVQGALLGIKISIC